LVGRVSNRLDFKHQMQLTRYDRLGRAATSFWFAAGASYPSNSSEYYYNGLGQLTTNILRSGTDASVTYASLGESRNRYFAALARVPQEARGTGLGAVLITLVLLCLPRARWRLFASAVASAWHADVARASRLQVEAAPARGTSFVEEGKAETAVGTPEDYGKTDGVRSPHTTLRDPVETLLNK
jgi:hypothetical protein